MILSRKIDVADRVFTIRDLRRMAEVIDNQISQLSEGGDSSVYEVFFEESLAIQGDAAEIFNEEVLTRSSCPYAIEMLLRCLDPERMVRVELRSGNTPGRNRAWVAGHGEGWVNATCSALEEALRKTAPQSFWWRRHSTLLLHFIAFGLGNITFCLVGIFVAIIVRFWPHLGDFIDLINRESLTYTSLSLVAKGGQLLAFIPGWLGCYPLAFSTRRWILSMWPSVEFDFGSPHLRPNNRRQKFNLLMVGLILPIAVNAIYDIMKTIYKW